MTDRKNKVTTVMKRQTLFIILVSIVAISATIPIFISHDWSTYFNIFGTILGTSCALYAIVIAILLYDRFSIEREVLSKQHDAVSTLAQNLNITEILLSLHTNDETEWISYHGDYSNLDKYPEKYDKYSLRINKGVLDRLASITQGIQLLYLPEEILSNCERLLGYSKTGGISQTESTIFAVLRGVNPISDDLCRTHYDEFSSNDNLYLLNQTLGEFFCNLKNLYTSIDSWFLEHGYHHPRLQMSLRPNTIVAAESPYNPPLMDSQSKSMNGKKYLKLDSNLDSDTSWFSVSSPLVIYKVMTKQ